MVNYYDLCVIPKILNKFKVSNVVVCGNVDEEISNLITDYSNGYDASLIDIDDEYPLNVLPELFDYDSIFINDDANWYTVFNELNIIKNNNGEFPLVFIANNVFPNKRRDSYINPNLIPKEKRNEFTDSFPINDIVIRDGLYHALEENTPHNGVLTAIEDFLKENKNIAIMDLRFLNGMIILYSNNNISYFRVNALLEELEQYVLKINDVSDKLQENKLLSEQVCNFESEKEIQNAEINYKLSKIQENDSQLDLKNAQIQNVESKLVNSEQKLNKINSQLNSLENKLDKKEREFDSLKSDLVEKEQECDSLKSDLVEKEQECDSLKSDLVEKEHECDSLKSDLVEKENNFVNRESQLSNQLNSTNNELSIYNDKLNSMEKRYIKQLSRLEEKQYCISCYQDEIDNNHVQIEYLKKENLIKKIFSPMAYVYLIFKSSPKELSLNYKLYKMLKKSNCFDIGFYLNNNKDLLGSKWCKYFSPELHYVCIGFSEGRNFNKKYFNRNSKKELLDYIVNCR